MISKIHSAIPYGFNGKSVEVEGDMNKGLPAFNIVGMASKTVNEARERVRSALTNSGFFFPERKVTINLAPADLTKTGAYLDLPIALSVLVLSGQLLKSDVARRLFVGELSLNGKLRPVKGIINIVEEAKRAGIHEVYLPVDNLVQAALIHGIKIYGVATLQELFMHLKGQACLHSPEPTVAPAKAIFEPTGPFLDHIRGQNMAKRALEIAVAGHHNILISGPPGSGKTLLAKAVMSLLPPLSDREKIDVTKIYSLAGTATDTIINTRPFRCPHHTASAASIIGGGAQVAPGEITLAHTGVLFLDELLEFPRNVIEALRQPMEDKAVTISRANRKTTYPADFMLIATTNPCPCGYLGDPTHACKCTELQIQNYRKKLSGPLLDRIDLYITVDRVENTDLLNVKNTSTQSPDVSSVNYANVVEKTSEVEKSDLHVVVKNTITEAIRRQKARYKAAGFYNGALTSFQVSHLLKIAPAAEQLLQVASDKLKLSARAYFKTIKVAQTIADLSGSDIILPEHLAEALTYRHHEN